MSVLQVGVKFIRLGLRCAKIASKSANGFAARLAARAAAALSREPPAATCQLDNARRLGAGLRRDSPPS